MKLFGITREELHKELDDLIQQQNKINRANH